MMQVHMDADARKYILNRDISHHIITIEIIKENNISFNHLAKEEIKNHIRVWLGKSTDYKSSEYSEQNLDGVMVYYENSLADVFQTLRVKIKRVLFVKTLIAVVED
jgi:hypothetical protein